MCRETEKCPWPKLANRTCSWRASCETMPRHIRAESPSVFLSRAILVRPLRLAPCVQQAFPRRVLGLNVVDRLRLGDLISAFLVGAPAAFTVATRSVYAARRSVLLRRAPSPRPDRIVELSYPGRIVRWAVVVDVPQVLESSKVSAALVHALLTLRSGSYRS